MTEPERSRDVIELIDVPSGQGGPSAEELRAATRPTRRPASRT